MTGSGLPSWCRVPAVAAMLLSTPCLFAQSGSPVPSAEVGVIRCFASSAPPLVRGEGVSELVGDILITCHNVAPSSGFEPRGYFEADLAVSLNAASSNRTDYGLGPTVTDAVLAINEKHCDNLGAERRFTDCARGNSTVQDPLLARRDPLDPGRLRWDRIAIPIPGAAIGGENSMAEPVPDCRGRIGVEGGCHPWTTTIRLTNIRVNAAEMGASAEPGATALAVQAYLSLRSSDVPVELEGSVLTVAAAAPGIRVNASVPEADRLCSHLETSAEVTITEGFAYAFKTEAKASFSPGDPGWEEAYYPGQGASGDSSMALSGTRIRIELSGLPDGVSVSVPTTVACASPATSEALALGLVDGADANGLGGSVAFGQSLDRNVSMSGATGTAVFYEVARADPLAIEQCRIPVKLTRSAGSAEMIQGSDVTVRASLAPVGPRSARQDVRFVESNPVPRPRLRLNNCGTSLLFPFVTNRANFDTAIVITNTSADPLGSRFQAGRCRMQYHNSDAAGQVAVVAQTSVELAAGKNLAFTLSDGNALQGVDAVTDFQGYLVAECGFQHAQGFAFVTEQINGAAILAQGYLAEIVQGSQEAGATPAGP